MKLMFASDIHGSLPACKAMLERFDEENADRLILLGDLLYHGPRNDLPAGYAPKEVIKLLNARRDKLFCVRGNCDTEVDQMVLSFPIMADYALLYLDGVTVFCTHGHIYNKENPPLIGDGDILIHGHTHVQCIEDVSGENGTYTYLNPGSVALPKESNQPSYMVYEDGAYTIKELYSGEGELRRIRRD
jgi:hypothetical protein